MPSKSILEQKQQIVANLAEELKTCPQPIFLVGDGSELTYRTLKDTVPGLVLPTESRMHQRAVGIAILAERQASAGLCPSGGDLQPNYLRLSQAERERLAREKEK